MHEPCKPLMVCGADGRGGEKGAALSRQLKVPEVLLIDTGHPAGLRMIERGSFADPKDARTARVDRMWPALGTRGGRGGDGHDAALPGPRGVLAESFVIAWLQRIARPLPAQQQLVRVTEAVVARSLDFRFVREFRGLEVLPRAGELIATDGAHEFRAPYDNTVLVMPGTTNLKVGMTTVRLGRFE